ncbi:hypothetical protein D3C77_739240 [compost metagenome]
MNLIQAINKAAQGKTITSCIGKRYTYEMLQPMWCGKHYASYETCGMSEAERKGVWKLINNENLYKLQKNI